MDTKQTKYPQKKAGSTLRVLSKKRRADIKPSEELFEILQHPIKQKEKDKKSASPLKDQDVEV